MSYFLEELTLLLTIICWLRQRLSVRKRAEQKFYMEKFNLRSLNYMEVKKQYQSKYQVICILEELG